MRTIPRQSIVSAMLDRLLLGAALVAVTAIGATGTDDTVSTCRNSHDTKCEDCYGNEVEKNSDGSCPLGSHSVNTSWVDNIGFEHHHEAWDYLLEAKPDGQGCSSCGAAGEQAETGRLPTLAIKRVHRYRFSSFPSAFGPGVFTAFDDHLELDRTNASTGAGKILYFRVDGRGRVTLTETSALFGDSVEDGIYHDQSFANVGELRLFAADGSLVVNQSLAATAVLRNHDGTRQVYEVIRTSTDVNTSQRWARLIRREDRNGNAIVIAYAFPRDASDATLGGSRAKLWQMASATDAYGRSASFTYAPAQVAGRWVVSAIALPNGASVTYGYDASGLVRVTLPDGAVSTLTRSADAATQQTIIRYEEAAIDGIHRRKDARMTNSTYLKSDGTTVNQTPGMIRSIVNGAGERSYFNQEEPGNPQIIYVYEGGTKLLRITTSGFDHARKVEVATNYVVGGPLTGLAFETLESYATNSQAMITGNTDALGRVRKFERDAKTGRITKSTSRDGTSAVITYANAFARPSIITDRLGRVSERLYDAKGNLTSRTDAKGTPDQGTWKWSYNAKGQLLKAYDALYDATKPDLHVTDYFYDTLGQLVGIAEAADVAGGARATRHFAYDAVGRLVKATDPDGRTVDYTYDIRNRVTRIAYGANVGVTGDYETFTYATSGADVNLLTQQRDRNGNLTVYSYDLAGRRTGTILASGKPEAGSKTCTYLAGTALLAACVELGDKVTYGYDRLKRLVSTARQATTAKTLTRTVAYDNARRVAWTQDEYGRRTYFAYDLEDRAIREVRELVPAGVPAGSVIASLVRGPAANPPFVIIDATFDAEDQRLTSTDGRGIRDDFAYDARGRLVRQVRAAAAPSPLAALALTTTVSFDAQGNRTRITLPRTLSEGSTFATAFSYNGRNLLLSTTEAVGRPEQATSSTTYTKTRKPEAEKDFRGNTTTFTYYPCCDRVKDITDPAGGKTAFAYDYHGNRVSVTDANGFTTLTAYDGRHRVIRVTNAEGETTTRTYDDNAADGVGLSGTYAAKLAGLGLGAGSDGALTLITDPLGHVMLQANDGVERMVRSVDANGNALTTAYDTVVSGLVETKVTDPGDHVFRQRTDGAGLLRERYDAESRKTTFAYDANGNRVAWRNPNAVGQDRIFDAADREVQCTDTAGSLTKRAYNAHDSLVTATDALLKDTRHEYDGRERRISTIDRVAGVTTFTHDANGNLLTITDAEGRQTRYAYDSRNLLVSEIYPPGQGTGGTDQDKRIYSHDPGRRMKTRTDQTGAITTYGYDRANRLITRTYPDGLDDTFAYDDASRLTSAVSERYGTTVTRSYDPANRLTAETQTVLGHAYTVGYGYDVDNEVTQITYPNGKQVTRSYTPRHLLASTSYDGTTVATRTYDLGGRLYTSTAGNGLVETRTYRLDNTIASVVVPGVTDFTYSYDANKRKTFEDHQYAADEQSFGYDAEGRMTTWQRDGQELQNWSLTRAGDWQSTTRTGASAFNQTRTHSAVHETTAIVQGTTTTPLLYDRKGNLVQDQAGQRFGWDMENCLAAAEAGAASSSYRYDALGRRLGKIAHGQITAFVHDGAQVICEYEAPLLASVAIGAPALAGSFSDSAGTTVVSAGGTDIWGTSDQFRYAYATLTGDGTVTVQVAAQTNTSPWAKSGLMIREGIAADARNVAVLVTPGNGVTFQRRLTTAGSTTGTSTGPGTATLPRWLRLTRAGSLITAFHSADGATWTAVGSETMALPTAVQVGVAVTAHNASVTCTTSFTNFASSAPVVVSTTAPAFARAYVHGDYLDEVLAIIPSTGQVSGRKFAHGNHLYSLAALTDNAGAVVERYRYDGNGQRTVLAADGVTIRAASAHGNQRGFTGRYLDKETGLWCFRARQYSGSLGRFISRDPTEYVDGMSLYAAYFIPNALDPTGLETSSVQIPGDNAFWLKATYLSLRTAKAEWKKDCATATPTIESIELSSDQKPSIPERTTPLPNGANMRRHEGHYRSGKLIPNGQGDEGTATVTITGKFEACWTGKEWGKRAKWSIRGKQKYVMSIVEWEDWDERDPETGEWKHNPGFGTARETQHTFKGGTGDEGLGNLDCPCICNSVGKGGSHSREKTW